MAWQVGAANEKLANGASDAATKAVASVGKKGKAAAAKVPLRFCKNADLACIDASNFLPVRPVQHMRRQRRVPRRLQTRL